MNYKNCCISCKEKSHVLIKKVEHCNECFLEHFKKKIKKNLSCSINDKSILLLCDKSLKFNILVRIIKEIFIAKQTALTKVYIYELNSSIVKNLFEENDFLEICDKSMKHENFYQNKIDYNDFRKLSIEIAEKLKIKNIITTESLEDLASNAISSICKGEGICSIPHIYSQENLKMIKIIRPFSDILNKEILYYYFLNRSKISFVSSFLIKDVMDKMIINFIQELTDENYTTGYSILKCLEKINTKNIKYCEHCKLYINDGSHSCYV